MDILIRSRSITDSELPPYKRYVAMATLVVRSSVTMGTTSTVMDVTRHVLQRNAEIISFRMVKLAMMVMTSMAMDVTRAAKKKYAVTVSYNFILAKYVMMVMMSMVMDVMNVR
jgi:hypothetical protein